MSHDAEALLRANEGVRVQRFAVHIIESSEPAKTVTSLFTLSVLAGRRMLFVLVLFYIFSEFQKVSFFLRLGPWHIFPAV
jgi:hypothetical protein